MNEINITKEIVRIVPKKKILFAIAQDLKRSSDLDVYCVVKNPYQSRVRIYKKNNIRVEIFLDSQNDLIQKIQNRDEIAAGFLKTFSLVRGLGDARYLSHAKKMLPKRYQLPHTRRSLLQYRIQVINSKYKYSKSSLSRDFFRGQLMPYLVLATLERHGVWPESPKNWIQQLQGLNYIDAKKLLRAWHKHRELQTVADEISSPFVGINLIKKKNQNKLTYLS